MNYCKCGQEEPAMFEYEREMRNRIFTKGCHTCRKSLGKPLLNDFPRKIKQTRYSGPSAHQQETGGFKNSGHS